MHGWIILDKPLGLSSAGGVGAIKRLFRENGLPKTKVGHGGTLDPLATGVLPIALGEATKLAGRMLDATKGYAFTIAWGTATATDDAEGAVVATSRVRPDKAAIRATLPAFTGPIVQTPPAYSALKVDGERAYTLARAGETVVLAERHLTIFALDLLETRPEAADFVVTCSKGTYVRSLARDIALALGTGRRRGGRGRAGRELCAGVPGVTARSRGDGGAGLPFPPESGYPPAMSVVTPSVWGRCVRLPENASAVAAARRVVRGALAGGGAGGPTPVLLHGPSGVGKSLVVDTLVAKLTAGPAGRTARVLAARDLPAGDADDDLGDLEAVDFLALEDVQQVPARSVGDLCRVLDRRAARRRPTVVTASAGPARLDALPRRLTSRLSAGLVVPIDPFSPDSRRVLAARRAAEKGLRLTPDALDTLAARPTGGGVRPLFGDLERLAVLAAGATEALDAAAVEGLLADPAADDAGPVGRVIDRVAAAFAITPRELLGRGRLRPVLVPRMVAVALARELTGLSYPRLGAAFGRDHTTAMHACRRVAELVAADPELAGVVRRLRAELG